MTGRSLHRSPLVLGLALVAALASLGWIAYDSHDTTAEADRRAVAYDEVTRVASEKVRVLTNLRAEASAQAREALLDGVTTDFRAEFAEQVADFTAEVTREKVTSTGRIVSAAVATMDDGSASVLVAASGTVANRSASKPQERHYRLRVDLREVDGRWLVNGLEFVS